MPEGTDNMQNRPLHELSATASCELMHKGSWQKNSDWTLNISSEA